MTLVSNFAAGMRDALFEWVACLRDSDITISEAAPPQDDEYGLETILTLRSAKASTCPIEIAITSPEASSRVGLFFDRWDHISQLANIRVGASKASRIGFYWEPRKLSIAEVSSICEAVVDGRVWCEVGVLNGAIFFTRGIIQLRDGTIELAGPNYDWILATTFRAIGCVRVVKYRYAAWDGEK